MDGFINNAQISRNQIKTSLSNQQHAENVTRSNFIADGTQASASEAAPPVGVAAPQEPYAAERELHNLTHIAFRSWCEICVRSKARGTYDNGSMK
eukprot:3356714-Amphidinium_carterae.2